jgi:cytidine deaminase
MTQVRIHTQHQHGYDTFDGFTEVPIPPEVEGDESKRLYVINNMLAAQRKNAWDHERGGQMFHGAALIHTKAGKYYMAANVHLQNPKTTRNCAEANAATLAVNVEGIGMEITDLWFMGGKADLANAIEIEASDMGRRNTPCGSCLDVIWNNQVQRISGAMDGQTRVHMLPLNKGNEPLLADDGCPVSELKPNQVMSRTISQLLPHVTYQVPDGDNMIKASMRAGWQLINEPLTQQAMNTALQSDALAALNKHAGCSKEEVLGQINDLMVDTLHGLSARSSKPLKSARIAVVRLDNGEYYMGVSLDNGFTTAMQPAESDAIQSALALHPTAHSITDMFVMSVDFEKMPKQLSEAADNPHASVEIKLPDGAARDRLSKAGVRNGKKLEDAMGNSLTGVDGANVHVMILNDKKSFDLQRHMVSFSMRELLPYRFVSPKMDAMAGIAEPIRIH